MHHVELGDLWEAEGRLFWIIDYQHSFIPGHTVYEYVELTAGNPVLIKGHLTIQRDDLFQVGVLTASFWKKVA